MRFGCHTTPWLEEGNKDWLYLDDNQTKLTTDVGIVQRGHKYYERRPRRTWFVRQPGCQKSETVVPVARDTVAPRRRSRAFFMFRYEAERFVPRKKLTPLEELIQERRCYTRGRFSLRLMMFDISLIPSREYGIPCSWLGERQRHEASSR